MAPFTTEGGAVVQSGNGYFVHREVELRVDPRRFRTPPPDAARGATSKLKTLAFASGSVTSGGFVLDAFEQQGNYRVWRESHNLMRYDLGKSALGAQIEWEKEGAVTAFDTLEIFPFPPLDTAQIDHWSEWMDAASRRDGDPFAWHSEVHGAADENQAKPAYPFQVRFRLRTSRLWSLDEARH
jgi:hypothetical protein